jgi:hypothetical protein
MVAHGGRHARTATLVVVGFSVIINIVTISFRRRYGQPKTALAKMMSGASASNSAAYLRSRSTFPDGPEPCCSACGKPVSCWPWPDGPEPMGYGLAAIMVGGAVRESVPVCEACFGDRPHTEERIIERRYMGEIKESGDDIQAGLATRH